MVTDGAAGSDPARGPLEVTGARVGEVLDGADLPQACVPRPFLHPVRTLGGVVLTDRHPEDHPWHSGLGVALPDVDGVNCWGGPTFVPGAGYRWRDDHGTATVASAASDGPRLRSEVDWHDPGGRLLLHEDRTLEWGAAPDGWQLLWTSSFRAPGDRPVELGSPGSHGRAGAGYGGWFLRFARCTDVVVRTPDGAGEDRVHGSVTPWIAWTGSFDGERAHVLVEALDHRDAWFVRVAEYPAVGSALAWRSPVLVRPDEPLVRSFRVTVSDG
ncbi:PmoA family protein [Curtobacterium sp. HSID17257]|uniref:DUF6807 domain-containing protein n=1 Tax=Curtobacterium sp. HSID17257 TaxID=2419510 RepID=UPI000F8998D6|nr:PmoA family protein [Curtobacterium sp. HSID17257]RUQ04068.1 hypothetical protein D8M35_10550 [Curtobacterium sp. HSID17257]